MTVDLLILIMGVLATFQPTPTRCKVAGVFVSIVLLHCIIGNWLDGSIYYISAALCDLIIIAITANFKRMSRLTRDVHRICLISIVLNASGWVAYMLYLPPTSYNYSFVFLHLWSIIILMRKDRLHNGDNKLDTWARFFRFDSYIQPNNCN